MDQKVARSAGIDLVKSINASKARLKEIQVGLVDLDEKLAPGLQDQFGMGPMTVGIILTAYSHQDRVRSEAALQRWPASRRSRRPPAARRATGSTAEATGN